MMRIPESCAACLYDKQQHMTDDPAYLQEVRFLLENRSEEDTSPYLVYLFGQAYQKRFGEDSRYGQIKKIYNDLVLSMEDVLTQRIEAAEDPLALSLLYARIGNYIDFGAMNEVDEAAFLELFDRVNMQERDVPVYRSFLNACEKANEFLLITDNCGEIVLDKLMIRQLKNRFPKLHVTLLMRGKDVLNDATPADAAYVGLDALVDIVDNGLAIAGTIPSMLSEPAFQALQKADVILAKGQGNYESLSRQGYHVFYAFLCKCELFMNRFQVPKLTGIFVEESGDE